MNLSQSSEYNTSFLLTVFVVCILHAGIICWMLANGEESLILRKRPPLVVRTVQLQEKKQPMTAVPQTDEPAPVPSAPLEAPSKIVEPPKTVEPPIQKKEDAKVPLEEPKKETPPSKPATPKQETLKKTVNKPVEKPKEKPKTQPSPKQPEQKKEQSKKTEPPSPVKPQLEDKAALEKVRQEKIKQQELFQKAQARLSNFKEVRIASASPPAAINAPAIDKLHIDALPLEHSKEWSMQEIRYQDELASRLQLFLKLPEKGDIKLKLTLQRSGKVEKVEILSSQSAANRKYVEDKLPTLSLPGFGSHFGTAPTYAFTILLQSEL